MDDQVDHDSSHVFGRQLPLGSRAGVGSAEPCEHGPRAHRADADAVVTKLLHQRLAKRIQAGLGGRVRGAAGERVLAGQAADVDDPAAAALAQVGNCRVRAAWPRRGR